VWIGFFAQGKLKKVPASGGSVTTIVPNVAGSPAAWGEGDDIYYAKGAIFRVAAAGGGQAQRVTRVDHSKGEINHYNPVILPGSQALVYTIWRGPGWDEKDIVVQRLDGGTKKLLVRGAGTAKYVPTGHLVYSRAGALMGVRFDLSRLETMGAPVTLLDDVREGTRNADYDVSSAGSIAYVGQSPGAYDRVPVIVDRSGNATPLPGLRPAYYQSPRFSPDGSLLALMRTDAFIDILVYEFRRASATRLTTEGSSQDPVWSFDGSRVAYRATRSGTRNIWWRPVDGSSGEERLTKGQQVQTPWSASPDGAVLAYGQGSDVWLLPLTGDQPPSPLIHDERANESWAQFSPDGRCLAYVSSRSGSPEVYVVPYPELKAGKQVSRDGGNEPRWAGSGRELFYRFGGQLMSVSIDADSACRPSSPRQLNISGDYISGTGPTIDYDVHPDGNQFVMIRPAQPDPPVTHINFLQNWFEVLKARLPR
jgi:serine/threonine-protein kinase